MKNKRISIFIILVLFILPVVHGQQAWQWGKGFGNDVKDIAVDNHGNSYVVWQLENNYTIDGHTINGFGNTDLAITSFKCDGTYRWTQIAGTDSYDGALTVGVDSMGGVYLLGGVASAGTDSIYIGNDTVIAPTIKDVMLIKYDTSGNFKWVRMPQPDTLTSVNTAGVFSMDVTADGVCNIIATLSPGSYGGGALIATYPREANNNKGSSIYDLKYDRNGNCIGGTHFDMSYVGTSTASFKFKRDPLTKNYYFSGSIENGTDTIKLGNTRITKSMYLSCFDSIGNVKWIQQNEDTIFYVNVGRPVLDEQGNIYLSGGTMSGDSWGFYNFTNNISSLGYRFPFLLKFDKDGNVLWGTNASTNAVSQGAIAAYQNGVVALSSGYGMNMNWNGFEAYNTSQGYRVSLARFHAATGAIFGFDTLINSPNNNNVATVLTSDKQGNFYVGGNFAGAIHIAGNTFYNQSSTHDGFIAKFGSANCNCVLPNAHFSYGILLSGSSVSFSYDGSQPVDSVVWDFGDGHTGSGTSLSHVYDTAGSYTVCATAYNDCGSNSYCSAVATGTNGIGQIPSFASISIYPNPTTQTLKIDLAGEGIHLSVYDVLGKRVLQTALDKTRLLDVHTLAPGVYQIEFRDKDGNRGFARFVKQN